MITIDIFNKISISSFAITFAITYVITLIYHILFVRFHKTDNFGYRMKLSKLKKIKLTIISSLKYSIIGSILLYLTMLYMCK